MPGRHIGGGVVDGGRAGSRADPVRCVAGRRRRRGRRGPLGSPAPAPELRQLGGGGRRRLPEAAGGRAGGHGSEDSPRRRRRRRRRLSDAVRVMVPGEIAAAAAANAAASHFELVVLKQRSRYNTAKTVSELL